MVPTWPDSQISWFFSSSSGLHTCELQGRRMPMMMRTRMMETNANPLGFWLKLFSFHGLFSEKGNVETRRFALTDDHGQAD